MVRKLFGLTSASGTLMPQCSSRTVTKSTSAKLSSAPILKRSIAALGNDIFSPSVQGRTSVFALGSFLLQRADTQIRRYDHSLLIVRVAVDQSLIDQNSDSLSSFGIRMG